MTNSEMRLVTTNLPGHFSFEPPPEGLKLSSASDEQLRQHGLPHRPDPKKFPKASRLWIRAMNRVRKFVTPDLVVRRDIVHGATARVIEDTSTSSNIWSGLRVNNAAPYTNVWGNWVIPSVTVPPGGADAYNSSLWVGLNGPSLLQAGTEQDATLNNGIFGGLSTSYYAWIEWFPGPSIQVNNFPVAPGDAMIVNISPLNDGSGGGIVWLFDFTTGIGSSLVVPIPTLDFNGNTIDPPISGPPSNEAVWILERPSTVVNGVATPTALADYGEAVMAEAGAAGTSISEGKSETDPVYVGSNDQGILINMFANDGVTMLSNAVEVPELQFYFTGGFTA